MSAAAVPASGSSFFRVALTVLAVSRALGASWDGLVDGKPYAELVQSSTQRT